MLCSLQQNEAISEVDEIYAGSYRTRDHACMITQQLYVVMQHRLMVRRERLDQADWLISRSMIVFTYRILEADKALGLQNPIGAK